MNAAERLEKLYKLTLAFAAARKAWLRSAAETKAAGGYLNVAALPQREAEGAAYQKLVWARQDMENFSMEMFEMTSAELFKELE